MKKILPFIFLLVVVGIIIGSVIYILEEQIPLDDTKKLYVHCGGRREKVPAELEKDVVLFKGKEKCELGISIRDIQRDTIKLKTDKYVYYADLDGNIDDRGSYYDIYVSTDEDVIVYNSDKSTKITFQFK